MASIDQLVAGLKIEKYTEITQELIDSYVEIVRDKNPIHTDTEFAGETQFGTTIAPGGLIDGMLVGLIGSEFPYGAILKNKTIGYKNAVKSNEKVKLEAEIKKVRERRNIKIIEIELRAYNENQELAVSGSISAFYLK